MLISAPQKGWSGSPCCALVMLSERARARIDSTTSTSFACDLKKWLQIMETYEGGGHAYHATMPTDALTRAARRDAGDRALRLRQVRAEQQELGDRVRALLERKGFKSVAAPRFPGAGRGGQLHRRRRTSSPARNSLALGLQIAAGVPLQCDEPADFQTFRIGLFGLDKLHNVDRTVANLEEALERALQPAEARAA